LEAENWKIVVLGQPGAKNFVRLSSQQEEAKCGGVYRSSQRWLAESLNRRIAVFRPA
jgi:hypothetical protein